MRIPPARVKGAYSPLESCLLSVLCSQSKAFEMVVAGQLLGELVRKLGDRVLPLIIPILSQGLKVPDSSRRQKLFIFTTGDMFLFCWTRPSPQDQKACIDKAGVFNYDCKYKGATSKLASSLKEDKELSEAGFSLNHARTLLGSGLETYEKGKNALETWKHFQMNWTFVNVTTPIRRGVKFCVCVKELLPWLVMPLQMVYVNENKSAEKSKASFSFGSGTLQGHLLAGEERFSVEMDENDQVWYEILSFSKPAHYLSFIGYPYVQLRQNCFAKESTKAMLKSCSAN
ncbi:hypothetical protein Ancab_031762 [Ancistrocladus abbreviatus]